MKAGMKTIFKDEGKLYQLVYLRLNGWSTYSLSAYFNCDRTSIIFHLHKYGVVPQVPSVSPERIAFELLPAPDKTRYIEIHGERVNLGRNYADYLK